MPLTDLTVVPLGADPLEILAKVPTGPGVGQLLGPAGRSLLLAPAANLRKWAGAHLGQKGPLGAGRRPKTNLAGVATTLAWGRTADPFAQRLLYERLAATHVPRAERRDLQPPAFLHLDAEQRFPRVSIRGGDRGPAHLFGPFRSRRAAEKARDEVNRRFGLRPCEHAFEPDPLLPLGLGCLYAQVRSCTAPCLARVSETAYRDLAARAAGWLAHPAAREGALGAVAPEVCRVEGALAVVLGAGRKVVALYPVREGRVLDDAATSVPPDEIDGAVARLEWPAATGPDDWPWLAAWINCPRGRGTYVPVADPEDRSTLAAAIRGALPSRFARPLGGDNVGASRGET